MFGFSNFCWKPSGNGSMLQSRLYRHWSQKMLAPEKIKKLGNRRIRGFEYHVAGSPSGSHVLRAPWPPHSNRTVDPYPNEGYKFVKEKTFPMKYHNVKYDYIPQRMPGPYGITSAWGGKMSRIVFEKKDLQKQNYLD